MKLLIWTDLEGVSGVVDWDRHKDSSPQEAEYNQRLLTNEVNGAVEGALRGGAEEVWVAECHRIDIRQIHPDAWLFKFSREAGGLCPRLLGMSRGKWDAMAFIGCHSMEGTAEGVLSHTQNHLSVKSIHLNGRLTGEFGIQAAVAGSFGMPMILVSGDKAACDEAKEFTPGIETAVVKIGTGRFSAWCMPPARARKTIADAAERAVKKWRAAVPFTVDGPVEIYEEHHNGETNKFKAPDAAEAYDIRAQKVFIKT